MHILVGPTTTCTEVLRKILEKCRVSDPLAKYQLSVIARDGRGALTLSLVL